MKIAAAHRQHSTAAFEVDVGGFVGAAGDVADGAQVHHHGAVYLRELGGIELRGQLFQRGADRRFAEMAGANAVNDSVVVSVTIP